MLFGISAQIGPDKRIHACAYVNFDLSFDEINKSVVAVADVLRCMDRSGWDLLV